MHAHDCDMWRIVYMHLLLLAALVLSYHILSVPFIHLMICVPQIIQIIITASFWLWCYVTQSSLHMKTYIFSFLMVWRNNCKDLLYHVMKHIRIYIHWTFYPLNLYYHRYKIFAWLAFVVYFWIQSQDQMLLK